MHRPNPSASAALSSAHLGSAQKLSKYMGGRSCRAPIGDASWSNSRGTASHKLPIVFCRRGRGYVEHTADAFLAVVSARSGGGDTALDAVATRDRVSRGVRIEPWQSTRSISGCCRRLFSADAAPRKSTASLYSTRRRATWQMFFGQYCERMTIKRLASAEPAILRYSALFSAEFLDRRGWTGESS